EAKLSRQLDRVVNPQISQKPSPDAVRVARRSATTIAATKAMQVAASAAGARLIDVSVPAGARGDEAYGIGIVDGTGLGGWATWPGDGSRGPGTRGGRRTRARSACGPPVRLRSPAA